MADHRDADGDGSADGTLDPADALQLTAHEIRQKILRELWQADGHALSFSELRRRVGVRDSGKFTYHLSKLEGRFLAHADDRYELLYPGHRVVDAIQSGVFNERVDHEPIPLASACPHCDGELRFRYADYAGRVECPDCERTVVGYPFDPGGFAWPDEAGVVHTFDRRTRRYWLSAAEGVCLACGGPTDVTVTDDAAEMVGLDSYDEHYASDQPMLVATDCRHCSFFNNVPVGSVLLDHPGVVGRLYERGLDVRERYLWELAFVVDPGRVQVVGEDPRRVTVTAGTGLSGPALRVTVDASGSITGITER